MRVNKVIKEVLGLGADVVIAGWALSELDGDTATGVRPALQVRVRQRVSRRWRHLDVGYTCELVADAARVDCGVHGVTVAAVAWARHGSAFTAALEDLVVHDAVVDKKKAAADRYGLKGCAGGIMPLADVNLFSYGVSPNTLFDYLSAGLPVITNVPGEVARMVKEAGAGIVVPPADGVAMAEAIIGVLDGTERFENGLEWVRQHHDRARLATALEEVVRSRQRCL